VTPEELRESLERGELRSAYLVVGGEALLRDEALAALRAAVLGDAPVDFDLDRLDGERLSAAGLLDAVKTLPVVASHRLVIVREPEARGSGRGVGDAIAEVVGGLDRQADAVLVVVAEKADGRARWVKAFDAAAVVRCEPPRTQRELVAFIREESRRQGVSLDAGASELLAERVGPQLLLLRREIEKAALLVPGKGGKVGSAEIAAGTPTLAEGPVWDLTDAIGEGRTSDALRLLSRLLAGGSAPPLVLGSLASHFRRLLRLRTGGSVQAPPFVQRKLDRQAQRYGPRRLAACLRAIHETDLALKGAGHLRPELALERLVMGLAG
jgi:DNA polymerase-3 subunit delta